MIDLSIILNAHDEQKYFAATIRSISEAVSYAQSKGITVELIPVLDNSTDAFKEFASATLEQYPSLNAQPIISAHVGSLGLARNIGIAKAKGTFIATADADDLLSFNYFSDLFELTRKSQDKIVAIPSFLYAFGNQQDHIYEMLGSDQIPIETLSEFHTFTSRILLPRQVFSELQYEDASPASGYRFEDWHIAQELVAKGYRYVVAPDTFIYYRLRTQSLMAQAKATAVAPPRYSSFLNPTNFVRIVEKSRTHPAPVASPTRHRDTFFKSAIITELLEAANNIDPQVNPILHKNRWRYMSNARFDPSGGKTYFDVAKLLQDKTFSDVWIAPIVSKGGAEKYIIDVLNSKCSALGKDQKLLVLILEEFDRDPEWVDRLPEGAIVIALAKMFKERMTSKAFDKDNDHETFFKRLRALLFTIVQTCRQTNPSVHFHLSGGAQTWKFFGDYKQQLKNSTFIYYRFNDRAQSIHDKNWDAGNDYANVLEHIDFLDLIVSDNKYVVDKDIRLLGFNKGTQTHIYARTKTHLKALPSVTRLGKMRMLWAARLDHQKRPGLLPLIADELRALGSNIVLDVYGSAVLSSFPLKKLASKPNLKYCGQFDGLSSIDTAQYLGFVHTSRFDGLPNTLIEALELALPVIAPNLGGIPELIEQDKTGLLIDAVGNDGTTARLYAKAIVKLSQWSETHFQDFETAALAKLTHQHAPLAHDHAISAAFSELSDGQNLNRDA